VVIPIHMAVHIRRVGNRCASRPCVGDREAPHAPRPVGLRRNRPPHQQPGSVRAAGGQYRVALACASRFSHALQCGNRRDFLQPDFDFIFTQTGSREEGRYSRDNIVAMLVRICECRDQPTT
jgi:hypothetical protein